MIEVKSVEAANIRELEETATTNDYMSLIMITTN